MVNKLGSPIVPMADADSRVPPDSFPGTMHQMFTHWPCPTGAPDQGSCQNSQHQQQYCSCPAQTGLPPPINPCHLIPADAYSAALCYCSHSRGNLSTAADIMATYGVQHIIIIIIIAAAVVIVIIIIIISSSSSSSSSTSTSYHMNLMHGIHGSIHVFLAHEPAAGAIFKDEKLMVNYEEPGLRNDNT